MPRLIDSSYMKFPFRVGDDGTGTCKRRDHVREQIEQVLFTDPGERVFRPAFGAGVRTLVFEPNNSALADITKKRLIDSLSDALQGEVDPKSLQVDVRSDEEKLFVVISYSLATIGHTETHKIKVPPSGGGHG